MHLSFDTAGQLVRGDFQIVCGLQIHPESRARIEVASQPQRRIGSDAAALVNNFRNPSYGHMQIQSDTIHAELKRLHEISLQNLPRMNKGKTSLRLGQNAYLLSSSEGITFSRLTSSVKRLQFRKRYNFGLRSSLCPSQEHSCLPLPNLP